MCKELKTRFDYNIEILKLLNQFFNEYPDIRFEQALMILRSYKKNDPFYIESKQTYEEIYNTMKKSDILKS